MSGTNYSNGIVTRTTFSGSTALTDKSKLAATTKFINKTAVIRCDAQTSETQTNFTLPDTAIVKDVYINVIAIDDTETVDVGTQGTSNDPNGYLAAVTLDDLGIVRGSLADAAVTLGALLFEITEATTAAARNVDVTAGGDPVSYTCSAGSDTAVFDIVIEYVEVVSEVN
jgi:hypothetical protein